MEMPGVKEKNGIFRRKECTKVRSLFKTVDT